jgi:hypothetical protein
MTRNLCFVALCALAGPMCGCGLFDPANFGAVGDETSDEKNYECLDQPWTALHVLSGAGLAFALGHDHFAETMALLIGWELIEDGVSTVFVEAPTNQICDVFVGAAGWAATDGVFNRLDLPRLNDLVRALLQLRVRESSAEESTEYVDEFEAAESSP